MIKKYVFAIALTVGNSLSAQTDCTSAGNEIGAVGCVQFTYQNQTVKYKTVRAADGNEWLQQNLGSSQVATTIADENARGDYFQWGRWDDGHQLKNSAMTEEYPTPNNPVGLGAGNPNFYINGGTPWSGNYTGWFANSSQNDTWIAKNLSEVSEHNGMDPCKAIGPDWEIPTETVWDNAMQKENIFPKPAGATTGGMVRGFESNLKIAGAGARKDDSWAFEGQRAYIWTKSASASPNFYRYVYLGTSSLSTTGFGGDAKSHGYSIRCVNLTNNTLGIQQTPKIKWDIVPNPVDKIFSINTSEKIARVDLINAAGQKIKEVKSSENIDVSSLTQGIYIINITFENGKTATKKFLKK